MRFWRTKTPKKQRIAFDVEAETLGQIDSLVVKTSSANKAELFRDSLRLFAWWTRKQDEGYEIILRKNGKDLGVAFRREETE